MYVLNISEQVVYTATPCSRNTYMSQRTALRSLIDKPGYHIESPAGSVKWVDEFKFKAEYKPIPDSIVESAIAFAPPAPEPEPAEEEGS